MGIKLYICNMEQNIFIKDLTNQHIGNAISRLCVMADIEPPEDGKSIVEFLRDKYRKYDSIVIPNAFDAWMGGTYPEIMRVKKINMIFLSLILNTYIQSNYHKIKRYAPPALEGPKPSNEEIEQIAKKSFEITTNEWLSVYRDKRRTRISPKLMEISWKRVMESGDHNGEFDEKQIERMMEWISDYEIEYIKHISRQLNNPNKAKRFNDLINGVTAVHRNIESFRDAAKFALYTNQKFGIK